ncbi:MAG: isopentenyl phosphate kinase [Halodesulfurarchaeum sp.]
MTGDGPVILKLGGSVITEKSEPETVDAPALNSAARAIGGADLSQLVVVHGGGSFGHPAAAHADVSIEEGTHDAEAIRDIHAAMGRLHEAVLEALADAGVPAVPVRPFSGGVRPESGELAYSAEPVRAMLGEGFVPVLHGDVITTAGAGATILSGDELVRSLASELEPASVGLCTTAPGVRDETGAVLERIEAYEAVAAALGGADETDVTGGMAGKVSAMLELTAPAQVFGPEDLSGFLAGEEPGTRID